MALIELPRLVEKVRRAFGVTQSGFGATVSDEIVGVVLVDDVTGPASVGEGYPRGAIAATVVGPVVGELSASQLSSRIGADTEIIADSVILSSDVVARITVRINGPAVGWVPVASFWTDRRLAGAPAGVAAAQTEALVTGLVLIDFVIPANTPVFVPLGFVFPTTQQDLTIFQETANSQLRCTWYWRERIIAGQA